MLCIFCKESSRQSKGIEHIIPESLGNYEHTLPVGIVCDKCNNYFSRKIEKPLLSSDYFAHLRFRQALKNKKGRIPPIENVFGPNGSELLMFSDIDGAKSICPKNKKSKDLFFNHIRANKKGNILIFVPKRINDIYTFSRFLAKVGLEILAHRVLSIHGWEDDVIHKKELDGIRHYARYGSQKTIWPYYERRLYDENKKWIDGNKKYQVLHEFTLLYTSDFELYAVVAILGVEYTINLGSPSIDGYVKWLEHNNNNSPLYLKGVS